MQLFLIGAAVVLLTSLIAGVVRAMLGPTPADRMIAAQLTGTAGVALLLVLSQVLERPRLIDVALVFALLAGFAAIAVVRPYT